MTQPQDPQDPFGSSTRRFDPEQPTSAYPPEQYPGTTQYPGGYETGQYGTSQYPAEGGYGGGPEKNSRTKVLIGSIVAGLLAILLIAFLISVTGGKGGDTPAPTSSDTTTTTTSEETTTSETSTESSQETTTTAPPTSGQVSYRFIGDGDLVMVRYDTETTPMTLATVRSPWSVTTNLYGGQATLNAIVVRGTVTCQIVVGNSVIAEGTSSGGPISCSGTVPE